MHVYIKFPGVAMVIIIATAKTVAVAFEGDTFSQPLSVTTSLFHGKVIYPQKSSSVGHKSGAISVSHGGHLIAVCGRFGRLAGQQQQHEAEVRAFQQTVTHRLDSMGPSNLQVVRSTTIGAVTTIPGRTTLYG